MSIRTCRWLMKHVSHFITKFCVKAKKKFILGEMSEQEPKNKVQILPTKPGAVWHMFPEQISECNTHINNSSSSSKKKKFRRISTDSTVCWRTCCDGRLGPVRVGVLKRKAFLGKTLFCQQKNKFSSILYRARTRNRPKPICYSLSKVGLTFLLGTLGKSGFFSWWERNYKSQVKNL